MKRWEEVAVGTPLVERRFRLATVAGTWEGYMDDAHCEDVECDCGTVRVRLVAADGEAPEVLLWLHARSGQVSWGPGLAPEAQAVAEAWTRSVAVMRAVRLRGQAVRAWLQARVAAPAVALEPRPYGLRELDAAGAPYELTFWQGEAGWVAVDRYCVAPDGREREGLLVLARAGAPAEEVEHVLGVELERGRVDRRGGAEAPETDWRAVFSALREALGPDWREELALRRRLCRELAWSRAAGGVAGGPAARPTSRVLRRGRRRQRVRRRRRGA